MLRLRIETHIAIGKSRKQGTVGLTFERGELTIGLGAEPKRTKEEERPDQWIPASVYPLSALRKVHAKSNTGEDLVAKGKVTLELAKGRDIHHVFLSGAKPAELRALLH